MYDIVQREMLVPNVHILKVRAPAVAAKAKPGQFVIVRPDVHGERIPLTVADWDGREGTVTCIFMEVGKTTSKLANLKTGEYLPTFVGPLGRPLEIEKYGTVLLAGGCYGIGCIYPMARALREVGNKVITLLEARAGFLVYWREQLESVSDRLIVTTADGAIGMKGHAFDHLAELISKEGEIDRIIAEGCTFMMYEVAQVTKPFGVKTIVSLNPIMVDGTGMCGACRVEVGGETRFACVDGPHFDAHEVDWHLLLARRKAYLAEETISSEKVA
ncbi:MAG: sulfide/dihydroorotate dehydrogenase-like FAD/NAD-binding protein [bacterium]